MGTMWRVAGGLTLVLVMMIPLSLVGGLVTERQSQQYQAKAAIEQRWSRAQAVGGPMIVVPLARWQETGKTRKRVVDQQMILPRRLDLHGALSIEERYYGIYKTPVYTSSLKLSGHFDLFDLSAGDGEYLWSRAQIVLPISDVRGLREAAVVKVAGNERTLEPASRLGGELPAVGFTIDLSPFAPGGAVTRFDYQIELTLAGSSRLAFLPLAEQTTVELVGPWSSPSFTGQYLPLERTVDSATGFRARWSVMALNRQFGQVVKETAHWPSVLAASAFGVELFQPVSVYQQTERAIKYGILFVAFTLMGFFIAEVLTGLRLHPVQYLLLGAALCLFYLLLLALSEHIGFGWAYWVATMALALIIGGYSGAILQSRRRGAFTTMVISVLYGLLYWLVISENYSLLAGSLALTALLAMVMYLTRHVDWFAVGDRPLAEMRR